MRFKKILCALDFSPGSPHVMRAALQFANPAGAVVTLAHVSPTPSPPLLSLGLGESQAEIQERARITQVRLDARADQLRTTAGSTRVETVSLEGTPWREIVHGAALLDRDLIVTGARDDTGGGHGLLGSTAERIVRHATCPVLIVPVPRAALRPGEHAVRALPSEIKRILCPIDFSAPSRQALVLASEIALNSRASLTLLYVFDVPMSAPGEALPPSPVALEEYLARIQKLLSEWAEFPKGLGVAEVALISAQATPWSEIVERADDDAFDLVVLGTHGHGGLKHALFGSTVERVVRHAPCAVLTVYSQPDKGA